MSDPNDQSSDEGDSEGEKEERGEEGGSREGREQVSDVIDKVGKIITWSVPAPLLLTVQGGLNLTSFLFGNIDPRSGKLEEEFLDEATRRQVDRASKTSQLSQHHRINHHKNHF